MRRRALLAAVLAAAILVPGVAFGHQERHIESPARPERVPDLNRSSTEVIDVCKTGECEFEHIQSAVNAAHDGALIRIWPGLYKEEPSRVQPVVPPDNADGTFSYEQHVKYPNAVNLIAILGKKNLTLRGMGATPQDVVIDAAFKKHVGIRGDRADGLILQNFSFYHAFDHGVYVLDTDGYIIDHVYSGYSQEYPFLTFADDHGLMQYCEAVGGGDGGIYPGGSAETPGRVSQEIRFCTSHHNVLGYSGTQGNHVWVHDTLFFDNALGLVSDSETDHPNYPENSLTLERNRFYNNNFNVYAPESDVAPVEFDESGGGFSGTVIPVGVGVFLASGNKNLVQNNDIWNNARYGVWLASGEGLVVGPTSDPAAPPFLSSDNRFVGNKLYAPPGMTGGRNSTDFAWDGMGQNNCWQGNTTSPSGGEPTSDGLFLPPCETPLGDAPPPVGLPNPSNALAQIGISKYNGTPVCSYLMLEPCIFGDGPAPGKAKNKPASAGGMSPDDGRPYVPNPKPCGPSTCPGSNASRVLGTKTSRTFSGKASTLPATGVGSPLGLGIALLAGAGAVGVSLVRRRFWR